MHREPPADTALSREPYRASGVTVTPSVPLAHRLRVPLTMSAFRPSIQGIPDGVAHQQRRDVMDHEKPRARRASDPPPEGGVTMLGAQTLMSYTMSQVYVLRGLGCAACRCPRVSRIR